MAAEGSGAGASSAGSGAASAGGPPPAKRARQETPAVEGTWGCVADDVAAAVDWSALTKAFDEFTSARLWALRVTSADLAERLPLLVVGERRLLLEVLAGEDAAQTATSSRPCSQPAASDRPPRFALSSHLTLRRAEGRGRGWFARAGLAAGTVVLVEKPVVATLDAEWRNEDWAGSDGADTTALGLELAHCFSPGLGAVLANLHPQPGAVPPVPRDAEGGQDSSDSEEDEAALCAVMAQAWGAVEGPSEEEKERLRRVVQLNSLGFYTNSEQLCHHGNFTALTGSGLYALASGFNHSCDPNVARFSIGDVTAFVTNRPVEAGGELCISYIESELLCAPKSVRAQSLNRDFTCGCTRCDRGQGESFPVAGQRRYLLVDEQLQASLALLPSENRVDTVRAFLSGDLSGAGAGGSEEEEEEEEEEGSEEVRVAVMGSLQKATDDGSLQRLLEDIRGRNENVDEKDGVDLEAARMKTRDAFMRSISSGPLALHRDAAEEDGVSLEVARAKAMTGMLRSVQNGSLASHVEVAQKDAESSLEGVRLKTRDALIRSVSGRSRSPEVASSATFHGDTDSLVSFGAGSAKPSSEGEVDDGSCVSFAGSPREKPSVESGSGASKTKLAALDESTTLPEDSLQVLEEESFEQPAEAQQKRQAKRRTTRPKGSILAAAEAHQRLLQKQQPQPQPQPQQQPVQREPPRAKVDFGPLPPPRRTLADDASRSSSSKEVVDAQEAKELHRSQSSPAGIVPPADFDDIEADDLRDRLLLEMDLHRQTYERMKDLERKLKQSNARQPALRNPPPRRFGVTDPQPYANPPVSIASVNAHAQGKSPRTPKRRGVYAPPLQSAPPRQAQPQAAAAAAVNDAKIAAADARSSVRSERLAPLSRSEQSRTRVEAITQLDSMGQNTWNVRQAEKVARYQDLRVFTDSMWGSFFEWKQDANGVA
uniref:SET domain-containing protein n=1 Tax=Alexandrium monilatum TaxID=311494 RepID=A0A7S4SVD9_9DINO